MNSVIIKNLTKTFKGQTQPAIDNLSLDIEKGKITGLIGADGAGKTTLLRLVIGLLVADKGEISTLDLNPEKQKNTDHEQESCDADQNRHPVRQSQAQRLSGSVPDPSCQKTKAAQKHQISSAGNI